MIVRGLSLVSGCTKHYPPCPSLPFLSYCTGHMSKTVGVSVHSMEGTGYCSTYCVLGGTVALDAILNKNQRVNGKAGWTCGSCPAMLMEESEEESVAVNAQSARSGFMCSIVMVSGLAVLSYFF